MAQETDPEFEGLLAMLRDERGFDFTGYKRASLQRRVERRMQQIHVNSLAEYIDHLQVSPDEYTALFNSLLINVTSFFRDASAWEYLQSELIPKLLAEKEAPAPIRVWSAGCASGEEAYSLTIALAEAMGPAALRERVKVYATDLDEDALTQARQAIYTEQQISGLPAEYVDKYFEQHGQRFAFGTELRRAVIFGRNDLVQDAPISRVDILTCRNTLMYMNAETQARVLQRLHFALNEGGILMLGKAEMLLSHGEYFAPIDLRRRFFRRLSRPGNRDRNLIVALPPENVTGMRGNMGDLALRYSPLAQVIVSPTGTLQFTNERAESLFGLLERDLGRPFQDLEISYRPVELRSLFDEAGSSHQPVWVRNVDWLRGGEHLTLDVQVVPLLARDQLFGFSVVFHDVTRYRRLQDELERSNRQLETAYEELQSTNEELETTNEELQSTVEELETTNEELQSTNEELETMNEELHSTNDEFQAINEELRERSEELDTVNEFMQSVLTSLRSGVIVLDRDLRVTVWNQPAEETWGLRQDEAIDEHLLALDIGLPVDQLRPALRNVLSNGSDETLILDAVDRRGRQLRVRVAVTPLGRQGQVSGTVLLVEPVEDESAA